MSRNHVAFNFAGLAHLVNVCVGIVAVSVLGAGYLTAIGQFAGVA